MQDYPLQDGFDLHRANHLTWQDFILCVMKEGTLSLKYRATLLWGRRHWISMAVRHFVCKCSHALLSHIHFNLTFIASIKKCRNANVNNKYGTCGSLLNSLLYFPPLTFSVSLPSVRTHTHTHTRVCMHKQTRHTFAMRDFADPALVLNQGIHNQHKRVSLSVKLYIRLIMISVCMHICFLLYVRCERIK